MNVPLSVTPRRYMVPLRVSVLFSRSSACVASASFDQCSRMMSMVPRFIAPPLRNPAQFSVCRVDLDRAVVGIVVPVAVVLSSSGLLPSTVTGRH